MPEGYEVTSVREITDVNESGDLLNYIEADAKSKPHGVHFSVRIPTGPDAAGQIQGLLMEKAALLESIYGTE